MHKKETLIRAIQRLKKQKNAVILAHNYQRPEIQELADFVGDSLDLSRKAAETPAEMIVFCGVRFMAETAKILSPEKTVLLPNHGALCPMASMVTAEDIRELRIQYPNAKVVCYVNTTAEVKAQADVCCTSANALKVIEGIDAEQIIFAPDQHLAAYCQRFTAKQIIPWKGLCYVHSRFSVSEVIQAKTAMPDAVLLVHPECPAEVIDLADKVLSTNQMIQFATTSSATQFLIATEEGIIHRLRRENLDKQFYAAGISKTCYNMKKTTLQDIYYALLKGRTAIELPEDVMNAARRSLLAMLSYV